jgi:hypothetical protein
VEEQLLQLTFPVQTILLSSGAGGGTGKGQASTLSTLSGRKTMSQTPNQPITDSMASWTTYMRKLIVADDPHPMASRINAVVNRLRGAGIDRGEQPLNASEPCRAGCLSPKTARQAADDAPPTETCSGDVRRAYGSG